jgi:quinol monooxygenase YgiN
MTTSGQGPSDFRFTAFDFDPTKYDAMMSSFDNARDRVKNITGLLNVRVVRTLENRMMVMSGYRSRDALNAATEAHSSIFADFAQYIVGEPLVRSGERVARVIGEVPMNEFKYMRFVRVVINPTKYDAMMSYLNGGVLDSFKDIAGLSRVFITRNSEDHIFSAAGYIDKTSADAAAETMQNAVAGMAEYITEEPLIREGELVWLYQFNV